MVEYTGFSTDDLYNANVARYRNMRNSAPDSIVLTVLLVSTDLANGIQGCFVRDAQALTTDR